MSECVIHGWTLRGKLPDIELVSPDAAVHTVPIIPNDREEIVRAVIAIAGEDLIAAGESDERLSELRGMGVPPP
jgi:hypothetical protein